MLYIGIDWSQTKHDICIRNNAGAIISRLLVEHSPEGLAKLERELSMLEIAPQDCHVAIETSYNPVVDYLVNRGFMVYIIPPKSTKSYRTRYRSSGAYDDRSDAATLAWALQTDIEHQLRWRPDSALTQLMLCQVRLIQQLGRSIQRYESQLRAALLRAYPAALYSFGVGSQIGLSFLIAYPSQAEAEQLSWDDFEAFCHSHRYQRVRILERYEQLHQPRLEASQEAAFAHRNQIAVLAQLILLQIKARTRAIAELDRLFAQHPDRHIYESLPGTGDLLAPALLAKLGDDRRRFPDAATLQAIAGTCPVTYRSGKMIRIRFRKACDHELRNIAQQWALCSIKRSGWARAYRQEAIDRGMTKSHATRVVANRWLKILWKLRQTNQPYDEGYHLRQRAIRRQPVHEYV